MTIRQLADDLGVTKAAVRKHLTPGFRADHVSSVDGVLQIDDEGCELLRKSCGNVSGNVSGNPCERRENPAETVFGNSVSTEVISIFKEQLEAKDRQIEALQAALTETTAALQAAQALHAGTLQQIEAPKHWWQRFRKKH